VNHRDHVALLAHGISQGEGGTWADLGAGTGIEEFCERFKEPNYRCVKQTGKCAASTIAKPSMTLIACLRRPRSGRRSTAA